jgi:putative transcriptional regulator
MIEEPVPTFKELREARGWTQEQLGKLVGCLRSHISEYETGYKTPSLPMLYTLANLFEIPLDKMAKVIFLARPGHKKIIHPRNRMKGGRKKPKNKVKMKRRKNVQHVLKTKETSKKCR